MHESSSELELEQLASADSLSKAGPYCLLVMAAVGFGAALSSILVHVAMVIKPGIIDPEQADRLVWILAGFATAIAVGATMIGGIRSKIRALRPSLFLATAAIVLLTIGIAWTEFVPSFPIDIQSGWWHGFGSAVALATAILVPALAALNFPAAAPAIKFLVVIGLVVTLVWYLPVMINPPWSADAHHANPVLNDVLATYVGKFPLVDQAPQYTSLLGFPLAVLLPLVDMAFGRTAIPLAATAYLGLLALVTVTVMIWVAFRILPLRFRGLAPLIVLPVMLVSGGDRGSIGESLSAFPARMLLPVLVLAALLITLRYRSVAAYIALGALVGVAVLNNPELGAVALIAAVVVVLVCPSRHRLINAGAVVTGAVVVGVTYWVIARVVSEGVQLELFAAYARGFADGFYALPMPVVGTFLVVLMVGAGAAALGALSLASESTDRLERAGVVSLFAGLMTIGSFAYYVGRSSSTGQLQALLPFVALCIAGIVGILGLPNLWLVKSWGGTAMSVAILMIPAFALASVLQAPNPRAQWGKVIPDSGTSFMLAGRESVSELELILKKERNVNGDQFITFAVNNSNIASALLNLSNVSPINYLTDATISPSLREALCDQLRESALPVLIGGAESVIDSNICEGMTVKRTIGAQWLVLVSNGENR